jgi:hypothetical protein
MIMSTRKNAHLPRSVVVRVAGGAALLGDTLYLLSLLLHPHG